MDSILIGKRRQLARGKTAAAHVERRSAALTQSKRVGGISLTLAPFDSTHLGSRQGKHPRSSFTLLNWSEPDSSHNGGTAGGGASPLVPSHLSVTVWVCPPPVTQLLEAPSLQASQRHELNEQIPVLRRSLVHPESLFVCWRFTFWPECTDSEPSPRDSANLHILPLPRLSFQVPLRLSLGEMN